LPLLKFQPSYIIPLLFDTPFSSSGFEKTEILKIYSKSFINRQHNRNFILLCYPQPYLQGSNTPGTSKYFRKVQIYVPYRSH